MNSATLTRNLEFFRLVKRDDIQSCGVCGLPTITTWRSTYCLTCHHLVCVTCQDGHEHNFGPPIGMEPIDF